MEREKLLDPKRSAKLEIVANFMGYKKFSKFVCLARSEGEPTLEMNNWWRIDRHECQTGSLLYDISYDWLMPVYKQIIKEMDRIQSSSKLWDELVIHFNIAYDRLADGDEIEELFNWVLECIKTINKIYRIESNNIR